VNHELGTAATELRQAEQRHALVTYAAEATHGAFDRGAPLPKAVLDRLAPAVARLDPEVE
jgi:hypothetical protein